MAYRAGREAGGLQLLRGAPRQPRSHDARNVREYPLAQPARAWHGGLVDRPPARPREDDDLRRLDEISERRRAARRAWREGIRLRVVARLGREGYAAARRARGDYRKLRAHPPEQLARHGRAPARVSRGRNRTVARPDRV